jgi:hypothetical protein
LFLVFFVIFGGLGEPLISLIFTENLMILGWMGGIMDGFFGAGFGWIGWGLFIQLG